MLYWGAANRGRRGRIKVYLGRFYRYVFSKFQSLATREYLNLKIVGSQSKSFLDLGHSHSCSQMLWLEMALFSKKALHNIEKHS